MEGFEVEYPKSEQHVKTLIYGPKEVIADPTLNELKGPPHYLVALKDTVGYELPMSDLYYLVPLNIRERVLAHLLKEPTDEELLKFWCDNERKIMWRCFKKQCSKEARDYVKIEKKLTTGNVIGRVASNPKSFKSPKKNRIVIRYNVV